MSELQSFFDFKNTPWLGIILGTITGLLLSYLIIFLIRTSKNKNSWSIVRILQQNITNVLYFFIPLTFTTLITNEYTRIHPEYGILFALSKVSLIIVSTWMAVRIVTITELLLIDNLDFDSPNNNHARRLFTKIKFIKRIFIIVIIVIGIAVLLLSFDSVREYGIGILTSAGIFSVIIGFAAQKSIANLLAGIQIAFTQPIKIDDVVIVEGEWGRIEEINLTYVVVNIWDLRRLILPITYFVDKPFQNWTRNDSSLIGAAFFTLHMNTSVPKLREQLLVILKQTALWDGHTWGLQVTGTKDQFMELRAVMTARDSSEAFDLRCLVREELIAYIVAEMPAALPKFAIDNTKQRIEI